MCMYCLFSANFPNSVVEQLPKDFPCGIYFGWANVDDGPIHKMVMSVGWNPFYKNTKRTMVSIDCVNVYMYTCTCNMQ